MLSEQSCTLTENDITFYSKLSAVITEDDTGQRPDAETAGFM